MLIFLELFNTQSIRRIGTLSGPEDIGSAVNHMGHVVVK